MHPLEAHLFERARLGNVALEASLGASLLAYYDLLVRWNKTINLTALTSTDEAFDRLLLEPVAAAKHLPAHASLIDLGSGGGSPAIPLALALQGATPLVMVESKGRKAAFLREAARAVGLRATVEAVRFETLASDPRYRHSFGVVSMRAVRMDEEAIACAREFIADSGCVALFVSKGATVPLPAGISQNRRVPLLTGSELLIVGPDVPRETYGV